MDLDADRQRLFDRVRKLLALSTSPNVNEAATAFAFAQSLIERYRLEAEISSWQEQVASQNEAQSSEVRSFEDQPLDASKRLRDWKVLLAVQLAEVHDARVFVREGRDKLLRLIVVAHPDDFLLIAELYPVVVKMIESLTRAYGAGQDRKWCDGFRIGVVSTVAEKLREARARADQAFVEPSGEVGPTAPQMLNEADLPAAGGYDTTMALQAQSRIRARGQQAQAWMGANLGSLKSQKGPKVVWEAYLQGKTVGRKTQFPTS